VPGTLRPAGRQSSPFRNFVLKIHARCNLRCDYCYVYTMADQSWRSRPRVMSRATIDAIARRIADHAVSHGLPSVDVVLHGGEPLLAGPALITYAVRTIRGALPAGLRADFSVQTNGMLLDQQFLELFSSLDVGVGLSLDGDAAMHDRHRRHPDGRGSYPMAAAAAARLADFPRLFSGILSVLDLRNDPVGAYESLLKFAPPVIDFLLPHGNWSAPPPGLRPGKTPYADWLIQVFDRWHRAPEKETSVRLFDEIIGLLLGGASSTEGIGLSPVAVAVIESDGAIERSDLLKAAYPAAGATGLNVADHPLDLAVPGHCAPLPSGLAALAAECRACPVVRICGGGLLAHRYRADNGFDNPSVYCGDLYKLISHIRREVYIDLSGLTLNSA
jgi:uncharacterized protein